MSWTIEAKILPLAGLAGHLYIEIFDDAGARVLQVNGLATSPETQKPRSIGLPGDILKAYVSSTPLLSVTSGATRERHPHKGQVLFQGSQEDILKAVKTIGEAADHINRLSLHYHVLTQNSNSVFTHMVDAIATRLPLDQQALHKLLRMRVVLPGVNKKIGNKPKF